MTALRKRFALLSAAAACVLVACLLAPARGQATIYWANSGNGNGTTIGRAANDGTGVNQSFITGTTWPRDVAATSTHLYWTAGPLFTGTIGRSDLDGGNVQQAFVPSSACGGAGHMYLPWGIDVDSNYIYWIDDYAHYIGRASLDGTSVDCDWLDIPAIGYAGYQGLAVDGNYVYWATMGYNNLAGEGKIGRAPIDGSSTDANFITGLNKPSGIAVDSGHIYWSDSSLHYIGRASIGGDPASVNQNFFDAGALQNGLAVDDTSLLWTDVISPGNSIGKVAVGGGAPGTGAGFITGADYPEGVAITNPAGAISPSTGAFGSQQVGAAPSTLTFTLTSGGNAPLTIDSGGISISGSADFVVNGGSCTAGVTSLATGQSCTVQVRFSPSAAGPQSSTLSVVTNAGTRTVNLSGTGAQPPAPNPDPAPEPTPTPKPDPTPAPTASVSVAGIKAKVSGRGFYIASSATVSAAGRLSQVATTGSGSRAKSWCRVSRTVAAAGSSELKCDLGRKGRAYLKKHSLALTVTTTFTPGVGSAVKKSEKLTVKRKR